MTDSRPVSYTHLLAAAVGAIYSYLDAKKAPASLNRYYILKDLEKYIKESQ